MRTSKEIQVDFDKVKSNREKLVEKYNKAISDLQENTNQRKVLWIELQESWEKERETEKVS